MDSPDTNFGAYDVLLVGDRTDPSGRVSIAYFQFDYTQPDRDGRFPIPSSASIADGAFQFSLYCQIVNAGVTWPSGNEFAVKKVTESWGETTLTWNNRPSDVFVSGGFWTPGPFDYYSFIPPFSSNGFTATIRDWIANPSTNYGFSVGAENFDDTDLFVSSRKNGDHATWPGSK